MSDGIGIDTVIKVALDIPVSGWNSEEFELEVSWILLPWAVESMCIPPLVRRWRKVEGKGGRRFADTDLHLNGVSPQRKPLVLSKAKQLASVHLPNSPIQLTKAVFLSC